MIDALIFRLVLILSFVLGGLNSPSYAAAILALRDLYLALQDKTTRHTFVFAIFALEEVGYPAGSQKYVASLTDEQLSTIDAMIALECLAVNGNATWDNAPRHLLTLFHQTAEDMGTRIIKIPAPGPLGPYNDSQPFLKRRVPAISLFGITTQEVANSIIHSRHDNLAAFNLKQYQEQVELLKRFVAQLDRALFLD